MKLMRSVFFGSMLMLYGLPTSMAADMTCGNNIIQGDQLNGMSMGEVESMCGKPESQYGSDWTYKKDQSTYILHFNGNGQLESIIEQE
jgi:hypothetical protein